MTCYCQWETIIFVLLHYLGSAVTFKYNIDRVALHSMIMTDKQYEMTISQPLHLTTLVTFWLVEITCYQRLTLFAAGITFCITSLCLVSLLVLSAGEQDWDLGLGKLISATFRVLWSGLFSCSDLVPSDERKMRFPVFVSLSFDVAAALTLLLLDLIAQLLLSVKR